VQKARSGTSNLALAIDLVSARTYPSLLSYPWSTRRISMREGTRALPQGFRSAAGEHNWCTGEARGRVEEVESRPRVATCDHRDLDGLSDTKRAT